MCTWEFMCLYSFTAHFCDLTQIKSGWDPWSRFFWFYYQLGIYLYIISFWNKLEELYNTVLMNCVLDVDAHVMQ